MALRKQHAQAAFALLEVLVGIFVLAVLVVAMLNLALLGTKAALHSEQRVAAQAVVNEQAEKIRAMTYTDVGYTNASGNEPTGVIPRTQTLTRNGQAYTVTTAISHIDDSANGTQCSLGCNEGNADYKEVVITTTLPGAASSKQVKVALVAAPKLSGLPTPTPTPTPLPTPTPTPQALPFSTSPTDIVSGQATTISWSAPTATYCYGDDGTASWPGTKPVGNNQSQSSGAITVSTTTTITFTLLCQMPSGGWLTSQTSVTVHPVPTVQLYLGSSAATPQCWNTRDHSGSNFWVAQMFYATNTIGYCTTSCQGSDCVFPNTDYPNSGGGGGTATGTGTANLIVTCTNIAGTVQDYILVYTQNNIPWCEYNTF